MAMLLKQPQLATLYHYCGLYFITLLPKSFQITSLVIVPLLRAAHCSCFLPSLQCRHRAGLRGELFETPKIFRSEVIFKQNHMEKPWWENRSDVKWKLHTSQKVWQLICCWCFRIVRMEQIDATPWEAGAAAGAAAPAQNSLRLPLHFGRARPETQLKMIGDVISESLCRGVKDVFTSLTKLHPRRGYFQRGLIKLCLCLPSQPIHPREYFFTLRLTTR